jgi:hypothetical protein
MCMPLPYSHALPLLQNYKPYYALLFSASRQNHELLHPDRCTVQLAADIQWVSAQDRYAMIALFVTHQLVHIAGMIAGAQR